MTQPPTNIDKLREVGLITGDVPEEYQSVFEDLSDEAIDMIMLLKVRLDSVESGSPSRVNSFMVAF